MSFLSNIISTVAKPVAVVAPFIPGGQPIAAVAAAKVRMDAQRQQRENIEIYNRNREQQMAEIFGSGNVSSVQPNRLGSTAGSGFGAGFGNFITDLGQNIVNPFLNLVSPFTNRFTGSGSQQPAITTPIIGGGGQESQTSGTQDAFVGGLPSIIGAGSKFLKSPSGGFLTGLLGGSLPSLLDPSTGKTKRITRKMKSQARMLLNLNMGNLPATAEMLGITVDELVFILLKRFRNDGAVVTKAALRKTKRTVHRLKSMCDMYDSLRPPATRRRTPVRRAGTTLISNK